MYQDWSQWLFQDAREPLAQTKTAYAPCHTGGPLRDRDAPARPGMQSTLDLGPLPNKAPNHRLPIVGDLENPKISADRQPTMGFGSSTSNAPYNTLDMKCQIFTTEGCAGLYGVSNMDCISSGNHDTVWAQYNPHDECRIAHAGTNSYVWPATSLHIDQDQTVVSSPNVGNPTMYSIEIPSCSTPIWPEPSLHQDAAAVQQPGGHAISAFYHTSMEQVPQGQRRICHACGSSFKDIKAHILTHQNVRPQKCPFEACEYHMKGFARTYDRNRHILTHCKAKLVCPFCVGPEHSAERTFKRVHDFKRHLTAVHGTKPGLSYDNSSPLLRNRNNASNQLPSVANTCSTCSAAIATVQAFYEHLNECIRHSVQAKKVNSIGDLSELV